MNLTMFFCNDLVVIPTAIPDAMNQNIVLSLNYNTSTMLTILKEFFLKTIQTENFIFASADFPLCNKSFALSYCGNDL